MTDVQPGTPATSDEPIWPTEADEDQHRELADLAWETWETAQHTPWVAVVMALRPLIEAETRRKVAEEISESARSYASGARFGVGLGDAVPLPEPMRAYEVALRSAAVIARGES